MTGRPKAGNPAELIRAALAYPGGPLDGVRREVLKVISNQTGTYTDQAKALGMDPRTYRRIRADFFENEEK